MLKQRREKQQQMELVNMEQMVPEDHLLRKVDRAVDFSFIYDLCAPLYCADNGRPAIDPEILFRMLLVGYLYGIKSEARLEEEINYNIAYKWFCGLDLTDKAPDATTISQNRRRRFRDNNIAEEIFNEILRQCIAKGLVGGAILYTDSTHVKAKANKHKKKLVEVAVTPKAYLSELDAQVDQEREELGKKPFDRDDDAHKGGGSATRMQSTTDPESGQQSRDAGITDRAEAGIGGKNTGRPLPEIYLPRLGRRARPAGTPAPGPHGLCGAESAGKNAASLAASAQGAA